MNFVRGLDPKTALGVGILAHFWFGQKLGIDANDGNRIMWISKEFGLKILEIGEKPLIDKKSYALKDGLHRGTYGPHLMNSFVYRFKYFAGHRAFYVAGSNGPYGFGGYQETIKHTLGKKIKCTLYQQLYNYLLEYVGK